MDFNTAYKLITEAKTSWKKGSELTPEQQKEVKAKYVHRYTGNNKPAWSKEIWKDGNPYPLHFKDDKEWLENTEFAVTKTGKLCGRTKYCNSSPTFPNNPELNKKKGDEPIEESMKIANLMISEASDYFVKDALDKVITGDNTSKQELDVLLKQGLIDIKGNPTKKAKSKYSELFESLNESKTILNKGATKILFSYQTPVAVKIGDKFYVTIEKYSNTTSKHINTFVGDGEKEFKPASYFNKFGTVN